MSAEFHRWIQRRLTAHGLRCAVDGLFGPATRKQLRTFQRLNGLLDTGVANQSTVEQLRRDPVSGSDTGPAAAPVTPPWYAELERRKGLHEVKHNRLLRDWLRSDGKTLGDPAKLPWCGDAIQTAIALTLPDEPQVTNPYLARNWLKFGVPTEPRLGAIAVFWRGKRNGTSGHVGLIAGSDDATYTVLGANQRDAITEAPLDKGRLLGCRWPRTYALDTKLVARAANGALSTNEA